MPLRPMKLAVLHYQPKDETADEVVGHVTEAARSLGHEVVPVAVDDRVSDILNPLQKAKADLVINLCETFADDYRMEVNVAALMEMARIRYTGSGVAGLLLAGDKVLTKQLLDFHEVQTPNFASFNEETFETSGSLHFPLIVKPARSDASIGIGKRSVVHNWTQLTERVKQISSELQDDALAEEFIEGREVYVGVLGTADHPEVLPVVELDFGKWENGVPRVSDREVKFAPETDGSPRLAMAKLTPELQAQIERAALTTFRALQLKDYARVDFRISEMGIPYVLEANPNPYLEAKSELAMAAAARNIGYAALVDRILESAVRRYKLKRFIKPARELKADRQAAEAAAKAAAEAAAEAATSSTPGEERKSAG